MGQCLIFLISPRYAPGKQTPAGESVAERRWLAGPCRPARRVSPVGTVGGSFTFGNPDEHLLLWLQLRLSDQLGA